MRLAFLLLLWMNTALAAPFAVQVGETRLALDPPPGFADAQFTGSPRLAEIAESMTAASNRILLFALEDADLRRFMIGDSVELRRSALAVTPRAMQGEQLSLTAFKAFAAESLRGEGAEAAPRGDLLAYLDSRPQGLPSPIAPLRSDPDVMSALLATRMPSPRDAPPRYLVSSHTLLLVRGKALDLSVFCRYQGPADLEWLRAATERWIDELRRLNSR